MQNTLVLITFDENGMLQLPHDQYMDVLTGTVHRDVHYQEPRLQCSPR